MAKSVFFGAGARALAALGMLSAVGGSVMAQAVVQAPAPAEALTDAQKQAAVVALVTSIKSAFIAAQTSASTKGFSSTQTCAADADAASCPYQTEVEVALQSAITASGADFDIAAAALAQARDQLVAASAPTPAGLAALDAVIAQVEAARRAAAGPSSPGGQGTAPIAAAPGAGGGGGSDYVPPNS